MARTSRPAARARRSSWVATTVQAPRSRACSTSRRITRSAFSGSSAAVGSSASNRRGACARARAMATRWRWPTDSAAGFLSSWSPISSRSASACTRSADGAPSNAQAVRCCAAHRGIRATRRFAARSRSAAGAAPPSGPGGRRARARRCPAGVPRREFEAPARVRRQGQRQQVEQGALAAAAGADDGQLATRAQFQRRHPQARWRPAPWLRATSCRRRIMAASTAARGTARRRRRRRRTGPSWRRRCGRFRRGGSSTPVRR